MKKKTLEKGILILEKIESIEQEIDQVKDFEREAVLQAKDYEDGRARVFLTGHDTGISADEGDILNIASKEMKLFEERLAVAKREFEDLKDESHSKT